LPQRSGRGPKMLASPFQVRSFGAEQPIRGMLARLELGSQTKAWRPGRRKLTFPLSRRPAAAQRWANHGCPWSM
jgi:hypothetical protein